MLTGLAVELRVAMTALLAAAAATDARKWMSVYTELESVREQCLKVMREARREASLDAAVFDESQLKLINGKKGITSEPTNRLRQIRKSTNSIILQSSDCDSFDDEVGPLEEVKRGD